MAQEDYVIADQTGVAFRGDLNNTLAAIVSNNSAATEPATMYAYMWWADTNSGILKQRNSANNAWVDVMTLAGIKASDIRNTAAGGIAATNVQTALNELDTDKYAKTGGALTGQATSTAGDFNLVVNTALSDAAATLTAAQLIGGEFTITPTVARIQTLDTAANIISALSGSVDGSNFTFAIVNLAAFDVTVATAAGVTLVGNMAVNNGTATFRARRLSASTISVTRLEKANYSTGVMILRDEKANNTAGGIFTSGSWRTRILNDVILNTIAGASLSSSQITLPVGLYLIKASAPAFNVDRHKIKLANITDTSDELIGTSEYNVNAHAQTVSLMDGFIELTGEKVLELQHIAFQTSTPSGFGIASNFSVVEVYSTITIEKIG